MCEPISTALAIMGGASMLLGGNSKSAPPPVAAPPTPAPALQAARSADAIVKVGDGAAAPGTSSTPGYTDFAEKRVFGKPLGGLGRGGLGL